MEYYHNNKERLIRLGVERDAKRKRNDPFHKLKANLRCRTSWVFKLKGVKKNTKTERLLGATFDVVKQYIERQFTKGMNWGNHGNESDKWQIDHKIPLSIAKNEDELIKLCHYTNIQPLWATENRKKSASILPIQMTLTI